MKVISLCLISKVFAIPRDYQILKCYDTIIKSRTNSNQDLLFQLMRQLTLQLIMTKNMVELGTLKDISYQTRCMALPNTSF